MLSHTKKSVVGNSNYHQSYTVHSSNCKQYEMLKTAAECVAHVLCQSIYHMIFTGSLFLTY